ncbi:bifunctional phosphopantothenoylcysteine decarboxylase/phosphopantothenate--cysteine ligase CoaBC [Legionella sp. CNM-4043-24]|uniref:bifunctional phosphopantothenoylcysteine decarboxylase/phosphopantothenate--cysteine ligase CoaBC n=1 Tax=Legionella sp. CNM-4043-24 TaxID=3421646 RepID=UPI00403AD38E
MQDFAGKKIVLGICGGIAAYKSALLVRELTRLGAEVRVVMTESAQQFISPLTLQAVSGHDVRVDLFDEQAERAMGHIELARWADYLLVAPATANCLAKFAQGLADDLLSTLYLVAETPVIVCPAMNRSMWAHPATQHNCDLLRQRGVMLVGPDEGAQACGEFGFGRLSDMGAIINALRLYPVQNLLAGRELLITAGPTREALDPVRYLSNFSSGKMGYALAQAAAIAGARVTLISGPTALDLPAGVTVHRVVSASDMYHQVMANLSPGIIFIGCAAVADYAPQHAASQKIKKDKNPGLKLELKQNPDILAAVAQSGKAAYVVGFAAETNDVLAAARKKRLNKQVDMIIANQVGANLGFDHDENEVCVITEHAETPLPAACKVRLAGQIIAILAASLQNAGHST